MNPFAFIALGSNLGNSCSTLLAAMDRLAGLSDQPMLRSSLWQTTPVDCPPDSPVFLNAVVGLIPRADESPENMLRQLQELESGFGRQPKKMLNEPRPLDLDLITFPGEQRSTSWLSLPHPRAHLRRFVLEPLNEIDPELVLPGQTLTVAQLLSGLEGKETVLRLPADFGPSEFAGPERANRT